MKRRVMDWIMWTLFNKKRIIRRYTRTDGWLCVVIVCSDGEHHLPCTHPNISNMPGYGIPGQWLFWPVA